MYGMGFGNTPPPPSAWSKQPETLTGDEVVGDTALTARLGLDRLTEYLAKHTAFALYLERTGQA